MRKIIFFDTETTGNTEKDYICQLAYKHVDGAESAEFNCLYKPPVRIPPEASAVHHISNKMVEGKKSFSESEELPKVKDLFENENVVCVAHNANFDLGMLKNEGITPKNVICTLRVARELDAEGKIPRYNLQFLRYLLDLDVDAQAHDAMGDVRVLERLFGHLKEKLMTEQGLSEEDTLKKMVEISSRPSLFRTFNFGKYKDQKIEDVARTDPGYLQWLLTQKKQSDSNEEDWIYTLEHFLRARP